MTTTHATPSPRIACASLLLAATLVAHAAPMSVPALKKSVAGLFAGTYAAKACHGVQIDVAPAGVLSISPDGHVVGPAIDVSLFEPDGEMVFERRVEGSPKTTTVHIASYAGGKSFSLERAVPSDSPGFLEAGMGEPNMNVASGADCAEVDIAAARIAAPAFNLATYIAPMFVTAAPIKGTCHSMKRGRGPERPSQFMLDAHGVVVDGVSLPFDSASKPVTQAAVGSRFSDGTVNGSFEWGDRSSFHVERFFESDGISMFSFTIAGRPDAEKMTCQPTR